MLKGQKKGQKGLKGPKGRKGIYCPGGADNGNSFYLNLLITL